jgi:hypothetical protein
MLAAHLHAPRLELLHHRHVLAGAVQVAQVVDLRNRGVSLSTRAHWGQAITAAAGGRSLARRGAALRGWLPHLAAQVADRAVDDGPDGQRPPGEAVVQRELLLLRSRPCALQRRAMPEESCAELAPTALHAARAARRLWRSEFRNGADCLQALPPCRCYDTFLAQPARCNTVLVMIDSGRPIFIAAPANGA